MADDNRALEEAITKRVSGTLVTKWMLLAETVDDNGDTSFESIASDGMSIWDQMGFLAFEARFREQFVQIPGDDE